MQLRLRFWSNRNGEDPLLRLFIERYRLNLLSVPRENSSIGDLYLQDRGKEVSFPLKITHFLDPPFEVPYHAITVGEKMGDISGTFSKDIQIDLLFDLLGGFLSALGASSGTISKIQNYYKSRGTKFAKFRFVDSVREYIDL